MLYNVNDNVDFTKAIATDGNNNQKAIGITSNGVIDFTGYAQGASTLDVVVDDNRAYEAIIVIGQQPPEVINKQVTKVNNNLETRVVVSQMPCDEDEERIDGKCEPKCEEGQVRNDGKCEIDCPWYYYGCLYPYEPEPVECEEGFVDGGYGCEEEPVECEEGFVDRGYGCEAEEVPPVIEPVECEEGFVDSGNGCEPELPTPEPEPIVFPDNSVEFPNRRN